MAYYQEVNAPGTPGAFGGGSASGIGLYNNVRTPDYTDLTQGRLQQAQAGAVHDQLQATQLSEGNKMSRFNQIYGLLGGELGRLGQPGAFTAGGTNTAPPPISTGPVLNDQQVQQQVNQSRAATDQATQGTQQRNSASLAGRGFGSNSPLAFALNQSAANQGLQTNVNNETNTRLNASQMNAGHLLNSQQALSNQWQQGNQLDIERRKPYLQQQTALIGALAGLV